MSEAADIRGFPRLTEAEALFREGRKDQASLMVIEHLRQHRDEPRGLALLGEIALENGALVQAEQFLRRAARLGNSMEAKRNLAAVLLQQDRLDAALEAYTYLEREDEGLAATAARAIIMDRLGYSDEALAIYQRVVADARADARHWIAYGHSLRFAGRTAEAIAAYRRVTADDPERGEAWWGLADIKASVLTGDDIKHMEQALAVAVDALNIVPLHMALARACHDRGDHERAFGHYREGNRIRAEIIRYDPAELTREVDEFLRMPVPEDEPEASAGAQPIPIFLISLPRSGSTLLEQILGRHPDIQATGELPYVRAVMRASLETHMQRGALTVPQYIRRLSTNEKRALGAEYLRRAAMHRRTDTRYFIDKMPSNWSDILFIRAILPQARFVEIRRNAMDCSFSNYTHHFSSAHAASFDLVNQARANVDYVRLMDHIAAAAPGLICQVRYETLLDHPERELRRVLDFLDLDWTDDLLSFHESDRTVRTPSAEQVRRPLNRSGVDRWKPYAQWLQPLRDALGPLADA
jgi:tetratricopeptide (TPR) repeat protein